MSNKDSAKKIREEQRAKDLIDVFENMNSPLRDTINKLLKAWRLHIDISDSSDDETLDQILDMNGDDLVSLHIEDLFKYQWILAKWTLAVATQENKTMVDHEFIFKKTYEDNLKEALLKDNSKRSLTEKKEYIKKNNARIRQLYDLMQVSAAIKDTFKGLSDKIKEQKNVLNRLIDYRSNSYHNVKRNEMIRRKDDEWNK